MIKIELKEFFKTKNRHKDIILETSTSMSEITEQKEKVFKMDKEFIYIGEDKFQLEDFVLGKIPITDNLIKTLEDELYRIKNRFLYAINYKKDMINFIDKKISELDTLIDTVMSNRNSKVIEILNVINNSYKNIINLNTVYTDNILLDKSDYLFFNGERTILSKSQYSIKEVSQNYKVEIEFSKNYLSYIVLNDTLKTLDTFKVYFINGSTQVKFVKEFLLSDKVIEVNGTCTKIIIEGIGASEISSDIKICIGKNQTNMNRGIVVVDCDFSKVKIADNYHISAHEDIKIFAWKKEEVDFLLPYNYFKAKYYLLEKLVDINTSTNVNLIDNYLVLFIETNNSILKQIKIYGVDE